MNWESELAMAVRRFLAALDDLNGNDRLFGPAKEQVEHEYDLALQELKELVGYD